MKKLLLISILCCINPVFKESQDQDSMQMMIQKSTDDVNYFKLKKLTMSDLEENLRTFLKYHVNVMEYEPKKCRRCQYPNYF